VLDDDLRRHLVELLLAPTWPPPMTYEEFLAWADEDTLAEWVNGEMVMTSPASDPHQDFVRFLSGVLDVFVVSRNLGIIRTAPFQMKLARSGREPDLLFLAHEHMERLKRTHLDGPADLVVEITSPESMGRDRGEKFTEYEQAGIPEYWLIDPDARRAEFYTLDAEGRYDLVLRGATGTFHSAVLPGFWLKVEWLWASPLPPPLRIVAEIAGVDPAIAEAFERALSREVPRQ
jgi:Uma2 family endonuclease